MAYKHFTTGKFTVIQSEKSKLSVLGTSTAELSERAEELKREISNRQRQLESIQAVVSGESELCASVMHS